MQMVRSWAKRKRQEVMRQQKRKKMKLKKKKLPQLTPESQEGQLGGVILLYNTDMCLSDTSGMERAWVASCCGAAAAHATKKFHAGFCNVL